MQWLSWRHLQPTHFYSHTCTCTKLLLCSPPPKPLPLPFRTPPPPTIQVVGSLLGSFKALGFYPDCTQALLVAGRLKPHVFGPAENTLMAEVEAEVRILKNLHELVSFVVLYC